MVLIFVKKSFQCTLTKSFSSRWSDFAESVKREIDFYQMLTSPEHQAVKHLYPQCYFTDFINVE
jgi:hypothetical protein